jgi:protein-tyrosine phosphatase
MQKPWKSALFPVPCCLSKFLKGRARRPEWLLGACERCSESIAVREVVLIHCAAGLGRTAMLAIPVLLALGEPMDEAESAVSRAGSLLETMPQIEMFSWYASQVSIKLA